MADYNPDEVARYATDFLKQNHPELAVDLVGKRNILVDGRRLDLENVCRMVRLDPGRMTHIVDHYIGQLFASHKSNLSIVSFDNARGKIMPRIQPDSIFGHLAREEVAHQTFVNGTCIVYVLDLPQMTVSITKEQLRMWRKDIDEIDELARENLNSYVPDLKLQIVEGVGGGRAAIFGEQDGYDASRILMRGLHARIAPHFGGNFYAGLSARDMFVAFSPEPESFVRKMEERIAADYARLPYPISNKLFYLVRDGIAGTETP